jgi:DNA-binding NarL/FixJ family response regulator
MTTILIADDQALVRVGLRKIIENETDMVVVSEAADGEDAVAAAARTRPDVVLMDIRMPVLDGIEATRRIVGAQPGTRVLILTTFGLDSYVYDALRAGASAFMLKDAAPEEILAAVRIVSSGEALLAPAVTRTVIEEFARQRPAVATAPATGHFPVDAARTRGARPHRLRLLERRDLQAARDQRGDDQDARRPHPPQARSPRPHTSGYLRLRERPGRNPPKRLSQHSDERRRRAVIG